MHVAGVKTVRDPSAGAVQHARVFLHSPVSGKRPLIDSEHPRDSIDAALVPYSTTGRRKRLGALVAEIGFRRLQISPVCRGFRATAIDRNQFTAAAAGSRLRQQLLNDRLRLFVFAFAELLMPDPPLGID